MTHPVATHLNYAGRTNKVTSTYVNRSPGERVVNGLSIRIELRDEIQKTQGAIYLDPSLSPGEVRDCLVTEQV